MNTCVLLCGSASKKLGEKIVSSDIELGEIVHTQFPSGEWHCQIQNNIRGADVFLINSITNPANDNLMQLLIMADAARRASAGRITAIMPYYGYSRQDRKDKSRVPISAKLVMDLIKASGFNRVITMDLHAPQIAGFTNLPFDQLSFRPSLLAALKTENRTVDIVVAPDVGAVKRSEEYALKLDVDLGIISKRRKSTTTVETMHFIGDVDGKRVLIVDDITESCGTLIEAASQCKTHGAKYVYCAITHGCFTEIGKNRIKTAFDNKIIDHLFVSNTIDQFLGDNISCVDVAPIFATAIHSVHHNESISSLFS